MAHPFAAGAEMISQTSFAFGTPLSKRLERADIYVRSPIMISIFRKAEIDRQEAPLARATEANVVTLHPAAVAIYLDAVEQLAKALSAGDAKAACLKLRELIDSIVVAPRVKPGDPIHFEVRGRLAALMQPDPGRVSVGALVPRGGIEPSPIQLKVHHFLNGDFPVYLPVDPAHFAAGRVRLCAAISKSCV
jgi:hypothetical protein